MMRAALQLVIKHAWSVYAESRPSVTCPVLPGCLEPCVEINLQGCCTSVITGK